MSRQHPIIAVTGSSGAGTSTVRVSFERIFRREEIDAVLVEGDSFHRYGRHVMEKEIARANEEGRHLSHFGPSGNHFDRLAALFQEYGECGTGTVRRYHGLDWFQEAVDKGVLTQDEAEQLKELEELTARVIAVDHFDPAEVKPAWAGVGHNSRAAE